MQKAMSDKQLRHFGFLVGSVFALLGVSPFILRGKPFLLWALTLALFLIATSAFRPTALKPVYRVWMIVGEALGWVNTRVLLAVIFYLVFTPAAILLRLLRRDPLRRKLEPTASTYRISRQPRSESHLRRQF
jgi:hypothetical protein